MKGVEPLARFSPIRLVVLVGLIGHWCCRILCFICFFYASPFSFLKPSHSNDMLHLLSYTIHLQSYAYLYLLVGTLHRTITRLP